ncbi:mannose-P-dolichol utilization defect 1 protein homolog [Eurosta solidaginis]|uniref:mannose-P-dolichol utilization defect 1 protein homolog n=1 Tax=Eurosta solidaginis TaxID=178769 RepID=UPI0035305988
MFHTLLHFTKHLLSDECYELYLVERDFSNVYCFRALLSKLVGYALIVGSMAVKVPQVLKLLNNKSGEGISLFAVLLDLTAITSHMSYNYVMGYPFTAWGDSTFVALQTAAIAALVLYYAGSKVLSMIFCITYAIVVYFLTSSYTPIDLLVVAQSVNIPILLVGKLSQAFTNYRNGSTGQLSATTAFLLFFGSFARIFTSMQETSDLLMIATFSASTFANAVIALQMIYYWGSSIKPDKGKGGKKEAESKVKKSQKTIAVAAAGATKKARSKKID